MNQSSTNKRGWVKIAITCLALFLIVFSLIYFYNNFLKVKAYASVSENDEAIEVFAGDIQRAPSNYVEQRFDYLEAAARERSSSTYEAVIGFDDYYSVEEVSACIDKYDANITHAFMWAEGETGRFSFGVDNGDISEAIDDFLLQVEESPVEGDTAFQADLQKLVNGDFGLFAITVEATAGTLEQIADDNDFISYVDIMYNEEVEEYAAEKGKSVYYIELPSKPDNAL